MDGKIHAIIDNLDRGTAHIFWLHQHQGVRRLPAMPVPQTLDAFPPLDSKKVLPHPAIP